MFIYFRAVIFHNLSWSTLNITYMNTLKVLLGCSTWFYAGLTAACIVLYCVLLFCIMRPYTEGWLDRYRIGVPPELSEIRTQPWLSQRSLINLRRNSITSVLVTISWRTCLSTTREHWTINPSITVERITFAM